MGKLKERFDNLMREYGPIALGVYVTLFALAMVGFSLAIRSGVAVKGTAQQAGLLGAAWVATKLTQPIRVAATLLLTPLVARVLRRRAPKDV